MDQGYAILKGWGNPVRDADGVPIRYDGFQAAENARKLLDSPDEHFLHPMKEDYFQPQLWGKSSADTQPVSPSVATTAETGDGAGNITTSGDARPAGRSLMTVRQASVPFFVDFLKWAEEWGEQHGHEMVVRNSVDGMYEIVALDPN